MISRRSDGKGKGVRISGIPVDKNMGGQVEGCDCELRMPLSNRGR